MEIVRGNADLLEVVHAFDEPGGFARAACTAGKSKPIKMPMMEITTSSSTRVKPDRWRCPPFISWNVTIRASTRPSCVSLD